MNLPLLATIFVVLGWHAHRTAVARNQASLAAAAQRILLLRQREIRHLVWELRRLKAVSQPQLSTGQLSTAQLSTAHLSTAHLSTAQVSAASRDALRPRSGAS